MSKAAAVDWGLGELDLDQLIDAGVVEQEEDPGVVDALDLDPELTRITRRISGQYVEVIATWAHAVFRGEGRRNGGSRTTTVQVDSAVPALQRLADATGDQAMIAALDDLGQLVALDDGSARGRQLLVPRLRDWLRRFAALLEGEDADRLLKLVEFDRDSMPLLDQLAKVRGVGPRRIERLYLAGLFTVESLVDADPVDVAQVSGVPRGVAAAVVDAAARFEEQWRHDVTLGLRRRTDEVRAVLRWIETTGRPDDQVLAAVKASIDELRAALRAAGLDTEEQS